MTVEETSEAATRRRRSIEERIANHKAEIARLEQEARGGLQKAAQEQIAGLHALAQKCSAADRGELARTVQACVQSIETAFEL